MERENGINLVRHEWFMLIVSLQILSVAFGAILGKLSTTKVIEKIIIFRNKYILMMFGGFFNVWYLYGFSDGYVNGMGEF